eukprot:gene16160-22321_t
MCTKATAPGACADASNMIVNFAFNRNDPSEAPSRNDPSEAPSR